MVKKTRFFTKSKYVCCKRRIVADFKENFENEEGERFSRSYNSTYSVLEVRNGSHSMKSGYFRNEINLKPWRILCEIINLNIREYKLRDWLWLCFLISSENKNFNIKSISDMFV